MRNFSSLAAGTVREWGREEDNFCVSDGTGPRVTSKQHELTE